MHYINILENHQKPGVKVMALSAVKAVCLEIFMLVFFFILMVMFNGFWQPAPNSTDKFCIIIPIIILLNMFCCGEFTERKSKSMRGNRTRGSGLGWEAMASSCARGGSDCVLGKISSQKERSGTGTSCPGWWWSHRPWRCSKTAVWHFRTRLSRHGGVDSWSWS